MPISYGMLNVDDKTWLTQQVWVQSIYMLSAIYTVHFVWVNEWVTVCPPKHSWTNAYVRMLGTSLYSPEFSFSLYSRGPVSIVQSGMSYLENDEKLGKCC